MRTLSAESLTVDRVSTASGSNRVRTDAVVAKKLDLTHDRDNTIHLPGIAPIA